MTVLELVLLGVLASFWPTLLAIVLVAIRTSHPVRILVAFLVGGLLTCIVIGTVVVNLLRGSELISDSKRSTDAVASIVCGVLAIVAAYALQRYRSVVRPEKPEKHKDPDHPPWAERVLGKGGVFLAFGVGIVLNIAPGVVPIIALKDIAELDIGRAETVAILAFFYVIMFAFVEIPLVGYVFAPSGTQTEVTRFNTWLNANWFRLAIWGLVAGGLYLILRGIASAVFG
jgi:hypothetical protein